MQSMYLPFGLGKKLEEHPKMKMGIMIIAIFISLLALGFLIYKCVIESLWKRFCNNQTPSNDAVNRSIVCLEMCSISEDKNDQNCVGESEACKDLQEGKTSNYVDIVPSVMNQQREIKEDIDEDNKIRRVSEMIRRFEEL
ncbi:hypothetical protein ACOME3_005407 [Neoechinorhynchus agilis]